MINQEVTSRPSRLRAYRYLDQPRSGVIILLLLATQFPDTVARKAFTVKRKGDFRELRPS